jgi:nucleotide-binding universal stress UspA family protein
MVRLHHMSRSPSGEDEVLERTPMKIFERILAATDFSPASQPALDEAERLARECGARLTILHAYQVPALASVPEAPPGVYPPSLYDDFARAVRASGEKRLESAVAHSRAGGIDAHGLLREGLPDEDILAAADSEKADLLVLGTHGRRGPSRLLLGSVAARVVCRATRPVMTVRAPTDPR